MTTREQIIHLGDELIRDQGINGFSFSDIARKLNIKSASIHYHFATKTDLVIAIIDVHIQKVAQLKSKSADKDPLSKLRTFISIYSNTKTENRICLVGSLATDLNTVDKAVKKKLILLAANILEWVTEILDEGRNTDVFHFQAKARTKALMLISNMLASLQLTRLTGDNDFKLIKETLIQELTT